MILMLFIDGLGIGEDDAAHNALAAHEDLWPVRGRGPRHSALQFKALDACLGVEGIPQSATGQTALLTGLNAPKVIGKHLQGFPSRALIEILQRESIFLKLLRCGLKCTFANAYRHPEDITPASRLSVTSHALKASGLPFRTLEQLRRREALYHDFTNRFLREKGFAAPLFSPEEAADILVRLAHAHDFTLYEHFLTDVLAHHATDAEIAAHVALVSRFVRRLLAQTAMESITLMITSDHGNIEENRVCTHTRNPVPLLWTESADFAADDSPDDITGVTPWVLKRLNCRS